MKISAIPHAGTTTLYTRQNELIEMQCCADSEDEVARLQVELDAIDEEIALRRHDMAGSAQEVQ
jgi:hypothetical protein